MRTTGIISTKLGKSYPWVEGIEVCSNEGPYLSTKGDNIKIDKLFEIILKIFLLQNH